MDRNDELWDGVFFIIVMKMDDISIKIPYSTRHWILLSVLKALVFQCPSPIIVHVTPKTITYQPQFATVKNQTIPNSMHWLPHFSNQLTSPITNGSISGVRGLEWSISSRIKTYCKIYSRGLLWRLVFNIKFQVNKG